MRKIVIAIFVFFCVNSLSFSINLDDIVSQAFKKSEVYKNRKLVLARSRISDIDIKSLDKKSSFTLGFDNLRYGFDDKMSLTPKFTYKFGEDEEKFEIKGSVPVNIDSIANLDKETTINPSLDITKKINLSGSTSKSTQLALKKAEVVQIANELKCDLQFRRDVYKAISSCLSGYVSYQKAKYEFEKESEEYNADISLKNLSSDSLVEKKRTISLKTKELSLDKAKMNYEKALRSFKNLTGFEYSDFGQGNFEDIENLSALIDFDFRVKSEGNSSCISKRYDLLSATNRYDLVKNGDYGIELNLNTDYSKDFSNKDDNSFGVDFGAILKSPVFALSLSAGGDWQNWDNFSPVIGLSFSVSPDKTINSDLLKRKQYAIDAQSAQIDYQATLLDYYNQALEMESKLATSKDNLESVLINWDYSKKNYEYNLSLAELGYKSNSDKRGDEILMLEDAAEYYNAVFDMLIDVIDAKILNL